MPTTVAAHCSSSGAPESSGVQSRVGRTRGVPAADGVMLTGILTHIDIACIDLHQTSARVGGPSMLGGEVLLACSDLISLLV